MHQVQFALADLMFGEEADSGRARRTRDCQAPLKIQIYRRLLSNQVTTIVSAHLMKSAVSNDSSRTFEGF